MILIDRHTRRLRPQLYRATTRHARNVFGPWRLRVVTKQRMMSRDTQCDGNCEVLRTAHCPASVAGGFSGLPGV